MPNNDLIHLEDAINAALDWSVKPGGEVFNAIKAAIESRIKQVPAVDAVEVVRCRDCKFYYGVNEECGCNGGHHSEGWYCADGERRTDA